MEEIQVEEYVRTKGKIFKIYEVYKCLVDNFVIVKNKNGFPSRIDLKEDKHSKDITDLIEVGDIIEWEYKELGYYGINEVINRFGTIGVYGIEYDNVISLKYIAIKRILTHEQYESNCHRIGE